MRRLLPDPDDGVDPLDVYPHAARPAPVGRPWVMANMIASVDGAIAVDGVSGGLGGPGDKRVFTAVRASADWILVAAGTVRAERYGPPRASAETRAVREATGREPLPRLAVVTASLDLEPDLALFAERDPARPPLIITGSAAPSDRFARMGDSAEIEVLDEERPAPAAVLDVLHRRGAAVVLLEGGPSLNGQFFAADLVDELCLSRAPVLVGGTSGPILRTARALAAASMRLEHLLEDDGYLFARYLRDRTLRS